MGKCNGCNEYFDTKELNEQGYCEKCAQKRKKDLRNRNWFPFSIEDEDSSSSEKLKTDKDDLSL